MIVLASQSPRRAELLRNARIEFRVQPSNVPEQRLASESAIDYVQRLAHDKAAAVARELSGELVLGADTVVVLEKRVLEKPRDAQEATKMLRSLSGRTHQVMTGVCLLNGARKDVRAEVTEVRFTPISDEEIASYVASGEPMDRAGAYAIQGIASRWVAGITGCYFNVVGLPVPLVYRMLREGGAL